MFKRINTLLVGAFFFVCASAFASDEVDWSVFAAWCPIGFEVCSESLSSDEIALDEVLAPGYHAPSDDDKRLFSELLSVYQELTQGQKVSDIEQYVRRLKADIKEREQLYRYASDEGAIPTLPSSSELRHYRKELMYLKSLQAINQKQVQLLDAHQGEEALLKLKSQVITMGHQLDTAIAALREQLKGDAESEKDILRYFIYKREQAGE